MTHKLAICGATGRMGQTIARLAASHNFEVVGLLTAPSESGGSIGGVTLSSDARGAFAEAEVVIDFSHPKAMHDICVACRARAIPLISGTTNLDDDAQRALDSLATAVPVLWAANMSLGVQLLTDLVEQAVRRAGVSFDVEIIETHHGRKIDAPSGTAKRILEAVRIGFDAEMTAVYGREGEVGARHKGEVGVHAVRGGDIVGDHTVMLLGQGERIELTHRATSRDVFAHGALRAASFILGKPAGRYTVKDLLGG